MSERVSINMIDGVADVRLNRPEKMNALDPGMFEGLVEAGKKLMEDRSLRAVVLSGEGRAFSAGLDFQRFRSMTDSETARPTASLFEKDPSWPGNYAQMPGYIWTMLPVPVIAAVHGVAFGGGLQIAMGADIRFVTPDAKLSIMEIKWGLVP
ncbi:MAG: enoyl-CoA hydratase/isomerase family protein, partial [Proteobacteria bacterium]|nr:enoyl-CoA hydratase/isomerase family protein [Pseudomonadota bacterium]